MTYTINMYYYKHVFKSLFLLSYSKDLAKCLTPNYGYVGTMYLQRQLENL